MIFVCHNSLNKMLTTKILGNFTQKDFDQVFMPHFERLVRDHTSAKLLLEFDKEFSGWELAALWREIEFSMKHVQSITKIALIGNDNVIKWTFRLLHPFAELDIRRFEYGQREMAKAWLSI